MRLSPLFNRKTILMAAMLLAQKADAQTSYLPIGPSVNVSGFDRVKPVMVMPSLVYETRKEPRAQDSPAQSVSNDALFPYSLEYRHTMQKKDKDRVVFGAGIEFASRETPTGYGRVLVKTEKTPYVQPYLYGGYNFLSLHSKGKMEMPASRVNAAFNSRALLLGYGQSFGAAVQADGLLNYKTRKGFIIGAKLRGQAAKYFSPVQNQPLLKYIGNKNISLTPSVFVAFPIKAKKRAAPDYYNGPQ